MDLSLSREMHTLALRDDSREVFPILIDGQGLVPWPCFFEETSVPCIAV